MTVTAPAPDPGALRRLRRLVFLLLWLSYAAFYQSGGHNEAAHLDSARALIEDGGFAIDRFAFNSADILRWPPHDQGSLYSTKAPGLALVSAPLMAAAHVTLLALPAPDWVHWHLVCWLTTALVIGLPFALVGVLWLDTLARLLGDLPSALLGVLSVWLGSIAFPFATLMFSHVLSASLLGGALALVVRVRHGLPGAAHAGRALAAAGLLTGWAPACEYPAAIAAALVAAFTVVTLWREPAHALRRLLAFALPAAVGPAVLVGFHQVVFGHWWFSPYRALVAQGAASQFPGQNLGFLGIHWPGGAAFLQVLAEITFRPQRGLFHFGADRHGIYATAPVLLLALPGLVLLARRGLRLEALLSGLAFVAQLAFNAAYGDSIVYWGGGASFGPRHLIPMLPFLALPLAAAAASRWRLVLVPLLLVSSFYMVLATAVEPRVPYEASYPTRDMYLPRWLRAELATCRSGLFDPESRFLTADSVAGSVGKMIGLPAAWQLAPLVLLWLGLGLRIARTSGFPRPRLAALGFAVVPAVLGLAPPLRAALDRSAPEPTGLVGRYRAETGFGGPVLRTVVDPRLDFDWSRDPPYFGAFSAEWSGTLLVEREGLHHFRLESDDGSWLELDGTPLLDNGGEHGVRSERGARQLAPGPHAIRVRYFNSFGGAVLRLWWTPPGGVEEIVPARALRPR